MSVSYDEGISGEAIEGTVAEINALALSGNLEEGAVYKAADVSWVVAGGTACFYAKALSVDTISESGHYVSPTLNPNNAWEGILDWSQNQIEHLYDSVNDNDVKGASVLQNFPFGVSVVTNNQINEGSFVYTGGSFSNNESNDADLVINGGNVLRNNFGQDSSVTINNGDFRENTVEGDATVNIDTTVDVDNNYFG